MPLVRERYPDVVLDLVGSNPPAEVLALDGDGVVSHGWVPDLTPLYATARLSVAPLRFGAGVKGKVGESLGHGVPVVGTPVAFEGTALTDGHEVLLGRTAKEIAELWQHLSDAGRPPDVTPVPP